MKIKDPLGDRMKRYEERQSGLRAIKGLPLVVRIDGKNFSKFTKGMKKPFDVDLADLMVEVTKFLVNEFHAVVGYTQSDECTLILDPFAPKPDAIPARRGGFGTTECAFDGRFDKLVSLTASKAASRFMLGAMPLWPEKCAKSLPAFDSRVFEVPTREEAAWALIWREEDAARNAVSMTARAHYTTKEMYGKSASEMIEMLAQKGVDFYAYPARFRRGVYVQKRTVFREISAATAARHPKHNHPVGPIKRSEMTVLDLPPIQTLANVVDVLLRGQDPILLAA